MIDRSTFLALTSAFAAVPAGIAAQVQLPMTIGMNRCFVRISVAAKGHSHTALAWLDTGGGKLIVRRELARALRLKTAGKAIEEDGQRFLPLEPLAVSFGDIEVRVASNDAVMLDSDAFMPGVPCDIVFPVRLLRDRAVTFDYPAKTLTIGNTVASGTFVPVGVAQSGFARMPVTIAGEEFQMLLDTGASCTMLSRAAVDRLLAANPKWKSVSGAYGDANMVGGKLESAAEMLLVPEMMVAGTKLNDVAVVSRPEGTFEKWMSQMTDAPILGSLAGNVLRNFRFTLDYPGARASFEYRAWKDVFPPALVPLTLTPRPDDTYAIANVLDRASYASLRERLVGAELVAVDGTLVRHQWLWQVHDLLRGAPGSSKRLTLGRNGATEDLDVQPIDLWAS